MELLNIPNTIPCKYSMNILGTLESNSVLYNIAEGQGSIPIITNEIRMRLYNYDLQNRSTGGLQIPFIQVNITEISGMVKLATMNYEDIYMDIVPAVGIYATTPAGTVTIPVRITLSLMQTVSPGIAIYVISLYEPVSIVYQALGYSTEDPPLTVKGNQCWFVNKALKLTLWVAPEGQSVAAVPFLKTPTMTGTYVEYIRSG